MHLLGSVTVHRDAEGSVLRTEGVFADITERKRAEEELHRSREFTARSHRILLALSQAAQAAQRAHAEEEVYQAVGEEMSRLGYHVAVFTVSEDRHYLALRHITFDSALVRASERLAGMSAEGFRFRIAAGGIHDRIMSEGRSMYFEPAVEPFFEAIPNLPRSSVLRLLAQLGIQQVVYSPLGVGGEKYGLLVVAGSGLCEADVPAVTVLANQVAIAMENARLLDQVESGREGLRRLARQLVSAQEEERHRLSRELHDELGQALTGLRIGLELLRADCPGELGSVHRRLAELITLADGTADGIRALAQDLRPPELDALGLAPALDEYCHDFAARTHLHVDFHGANLPTVPEEVNVTLYRFLQETLTNVARHAEADHVHVSLSCDARTVSLSVTDDGEGFDPNALLPVTGEPEADGIGLLGLRERLQDVGGWLEIESVPGSGTCVVGHIPRREAR